MSLTKEQIEQRKSLVTASDVAAIVGLNPWRTAVDVWAEKVHGSSFRENYRMRRGHVLEPLLCAWLGEQLAPSMMVRPAGDVTRVHRVHSWLGATCDALVWPGDKPKGEPIAVGEFKTTDNPSDWLNEEQDWQAPDYYVPQVEIEMAVVGVRVAYVAVDLPGQKEPVQVLVESDDELRVALIDACEHFHRAYLSTKTPPPLNEATYGEVANVFRRPKKGAGFVVAGEEAEALAHHYIQAKADEKDAKARADVAKAGLCAIIGPNQGIAGVGWKATWDEREAIVVPSYNKDAYRHFDLRQQKASSKRKVA